MTSATLDTPARKPKATTTTKAVENARKRVARYTALDASTVAVQTTAHEGAAPHRYTLDLAPARCTCTGFGVNKDCSHRADVSLLLTVTAHKDGGRWLSGIVCFCHVCAHWQYRSTWRFDGQGDVVRVRCGCQDGKVRPA